MKSAVLVLGALLSFSSFACEGEAQLWPTKVVKIIKTEDSCRAFIAESRLDDHPECALDLGALHNGGIEVGLTKEGNCQFDVGSSISGYLVNKRGFVGFGR